MPFYRINGHTVHMRGTKLPPACLERVGFHSQAAEWSVCGVMTGFQCDWPVGESTCDRHLCEAHAHQVGKNRHYCPDHHLQLINTQAQPGLFTSLVQS